MGRSARVKKEESLVEKLKTLPIVLKMEKEGLVQMMEKDWLLRTSYGDERNRRNCFNREETKNQV